MTALGDAIDVVVLAGGKGTRLRSVLSATPKILAPICNMTFFDVLVGWLEQQGVKNVTFSLGYLAEQVIEKIDAYEGPLSLFYVVEKRALGTGGGCVLGTAEGKASSILVLNGDSWLDLHIGTFFDYFKESGANIALAGVQVDDVSRYGQLIVDDNHFVQEFKEKNSEAEQKAGMINSGVYLFKREVLSAYDRDVAFALEIDFFQKQPSNTVFVYDCAHVDFIDIGVPSSLEAAQTLLKQHFPQVQK